MKKGAIMIVLVISIIAVILIIIYFKNNKISEETAKCIALKSRLFVSKTCSHCAYQKQLLNKYIIYFNIVECLDNIKECEKNDITIVPAWLINDKKYTGVKTLKELKELAEC